MSNKIKLIETLKILAEAYRKDIEWASGLSISDMEDLDTGAIDAAEELIRELEQTVINFRSYSEGVGIVKQALFNDGYENTTSTNRYAVSLYEDLSDGQKDFVQKAINEGFQDNLTFTYSGKMMYGQMCPAVCLEEDQKNDFSFKGSYVDNLGKGSVIYKI